MEIVIYSMVPFDQVQSRDGNHYVSVEWSGLTGSIILVHFCRSGKNG